MQDALTVPHLGLEQVLLGDREKQALGVKRPDDVIPHRAAVMVTATQGPRHVLLDHLGMDKHTNLASCTSQRYPDQAAVGGLSQHTPWYKHCPSNGGRLYCPGKKTEGLAGGGLAHSRYMAKAGLSHACLRPLGSLVLPPMSPVSLSMERSWA